MIHHRSCFTNPQTLARLSSILLLTVCLFTADTVKADLINVTSVSDFVQIKDANATVPFDNSATGSNLSGNLLDRIIGSGVAATDGYRSRQTTSTTGTSINVGWDVAIPSPGSQGPDALGRGNSAILFTATSDSGYTAAGDNLFGTGTINALFHYKLRDLTDSVDLVQFTDGWSNGTQVNNTIGLLTGTLIAGHQYSWTSDFEFSKYGWTKNQLFTARSASGTASLTVTAIPEPSAAAILGLAGLGMLMRRRRR